MIDENWRLISTDRALQIFMVGAFSLLVGIITYCSTIGDFGQAGYCYELASTLLSGDFSCISEDTGFGPLAILLLIPPRLLSPDVSTFNLLFSLYGFAFYMLGGHFMLKSCRETGFSQNAAYVLLYITFLCAFTGITLSTGPMVVAFVITALWFYQIRNYPVMFLALAASALIEPWSVLFAIVFMIGLSSRSDISDALPGLGLYLLLVGATVLLSGSLKYSGIYSDMALVSSAVALLLCTALALLLKGKVDGMKAPAIAGTIGLIVLIVSTSEISIQDYIWIMMLYPMTRMLDRKVIDERIDYVLVVFFSSLTFLSIHVFPDNGVLPILNVVALAGIGVSLTIETVLFANDRRV